MFLRRQVRWSDIPNSFRISQFAVIHTVKGFSAVNEAENVSLEFPCFFYDPTDAGDLVFGSSAFSKSKLYIWKFLVNALLKPSLKAFEYYLASMYNEHNRAVFRTFVLALPFFRIAYSFVCCISCTRSLLFIYFIYSSVYMLVPNSKFISPLPPLTQSTSKEVKELNFCKGSDSKYFRLLPATRSVLSVSL